MKSGIAMAFEDYAEEKIKEIKIAEEKEIKAVTEKTAINIALKMLKKGIDIKIISEVTELSIDNIKQIQEEN